MVVRLPNFLVIAGTRYVSAIMYKEIKSWLHYPILFLSDTKKLQFFDGYNLVLGNNTDAFKNLFSKVDSQQLCERVAFDYLISPITLLKPNKSLIKERQ